ILTVDGVGEWATASFGKGQRNKIEIMEEIRFPHSLGLLYSAFTYYCGFKVNSGEYKLMGLAPYGDPVYEDLILKELIDLKADGSFRLNMRYFNYCTGLTMTNGRFHRFFGGKPRKPGDTLEQKHMDIARSIQTVTEKAVMLMAEHVHRATGCDDLCLAGGVALNCVANGRIVREGPFKRVWIQPAASDAGGALGAAYVGWFEYFGKERNAPVTGDLQKASLLGPGFSDDEIEKYLRDNDVPFEKIPPGKVPETVAGLIAGQKVVGWFQGRMEFGPRALGARSIIGDARSEKMQSLINRKIKFRESFRPFAPSVTIENASEYFSIRGESPYMLIVAPVAEDKRVCSGGDDLCGIDKLKVKRSCIPAVTHVDNTARVQTVKREDNPLYYDMIKKFGELYGCPVIINTSFNVRGEPIVCTPDEAYRCFMRTNMDSLVMGSYVIDKEKQDPNRLRPEEVCEFELD
ncbi:MAG: carbamoyltransferase C-terminal domain-containing protein, partial [Candidatus Omnitrophica bacterium]|nr:carbamoyltransferase C-terminal domain-containing protein [Candidatus Omnitrophota bacterium]